MTRGPGLRALWVRELEGGRFLAVGEGAAGEWTGTLVGTWPALRAILAPMTATTLPVCVCSTCRGLQLAPGVVELPGGLLSLEVAPSSEAEPRGVTP